jgi:hypothetical protein
LSKKIQKKLPSKKIAKDQFPTKMRPPKRTQIELIQQLQNLRDMAPYRIGMNTSQINNKLGNYQVYETNLRNRLFKLERLGFLVKLEDRWNKNRTLTERVWKFTEQGWSWASSYEGSYPLPDEYPF